MGSLRHFRDAVDVLVHVCRVAVARLLMRAQQILFWSYSYKWVYTAVQNWLEQGTFCSGWLRKSLAGTNDFFQDFLSPIVVANWVRWFLGEAPCPIAIIPGCGSIWRRAQAGSGSSIFVSLGSCLYSFRLHGSLLADKILVQFLNFMLALCSIMRGNSRNDCVFRDSSTGMFF